MGIEKQSSKGGGGYVGSFLHLFDWNAKSRKKLFSSKSDFPEQSKQKKRSDGNFPMTQVHLMDGDETVPGTSIKGGSDYSCASSVTDEDIYGIKAPSVVARLMGLDSLPTSNVMEPYSSPYFESQSLRDVQYHRKHVEYHNDRIMHSGCLDYNLEVPTVNHLEAKPQKIMNKPIEKFQTETLPPKLAKSIPITQHKLLSPIKSPGFIPSKNAAHIMEAAAKIIEPGPQPTTKSKMPLLGSSSIPLKVRYLKEKVEATQKLRKLSESSQVSVESSATKYLKGQPVNKCWSGSSVDSTAARVSCNSEECTTSTKNKGKSISLALQAKANVQKREGLYQTRSQSLFVQKAQSEDIPSQIFKSQPNAEKVVHKKPSAHNASNVLRQNNQKQNCAMDRGKSPSKTPIYNSQGRKLLSRDTSLERQKNSNRFPGYSRVDSKKLSSEAVDNGKSEMTYSSTKNVPRKKRSIDRDCQFERNQVVDNIMNNKSGKLGQSNKMMEKQFSWAEESKRKGMDVISFTFTAPMPRPINGTDTSGEVERRNKFACTDYQGKKAMLNLDHTSSSKLSSLRCNVIGGDALSTLLDQKLRELANGVESSRLKAGTAGTSASIFQDFPAVTSRQFFHDKRKEEMHKDVSSGQCGSVFSSTDPWGLVAKQKHQDVEEYTDDCGSNDTKARKFIDSRHPSPISVLEPSFFAESCNSSDTIDSCSTEGRQWSSVHAQALLGPSSSKTLNLVDADAELSDSASSTITGVVAGKNVPPTVADCMKTDSWELEYIKEILCSVELMFKDFALGRVCEIINPHLFDQLESRKGLLDWHGGEPQQRRKVIFDCVKECLDLRCRRYAGGGCRTWTKGLSVVRRNEWLVSDVYKEISEWKGMGDCMVDELVDKDMSNQHGKWLDFEVEAFELGLLIESRILNSLLDEVVADILPL